MFKSTKFSNQDVNHVIHFYHKKRKKITSLGILDSPRIIIR